MVTMGRLLWRDDLAELIRLTTDVQRGIIATDGRTNDGADGRAGDEIERAQSGTEPPDHAHYLEKRSARLGQPSP